MREMGFDFFTLCVPLLSQSSEHIANRNTVSIGHSRPCYYSKTVFPYYPPPGLQRVTAAVLRSSHHPHLRPLCGPWTGWSSGRATCGLRACSRCLRARSGRTTSPPKCTLVRHTLGLGWLWSGRTTSLPKCTTARQSAPFAWQRRPELGTRLLAGCPAAAPSGLRANRIHRRRSRRL